MDIKQQYVLLTGASGGIGQKIAHTLAQSGAWLILVGRDTQKLEALRQSLLLPEKHLILSADLSKDEGIEQLEKLAEQINQRQQRISVVINNAGTNQFCLFARRSMASLQHELVLNLLTPIHITHMALRWASKPELIVNIGSSFGAIGYPGYATYCAAKAGLHRFSEAMNRELDGSGVKVLYLAPRATNTALNSEAVQQLNRALGNHCDEPEVVAEQVKKMIETEQSVLWMGWPEKLFVRLNQLLPSVVSNAIKKQQHILLSYLNR
ncbi:oxidoreductase short-chain dehydrogenase/reductase family [Vibrio sp. RC586]|uniref:SDR family oxidoreductase n=1 Tax=Vibrio sp. RC586 TaxID=675815 RepID=UPI0001BB7E88|nr:SDR family oxidoreductase [Vibrio sp. RC586]EEY99779.1 oxidoreductase short-chain dehydrogenase/reductase family [Vibrio sp. RC586]